MNKKVFEVVAGVILFGFIGLMIAVYYPVFSSEKTICMISDTCWDASRKIYIAEGALFGLFIGFVSSLVMKTKQPIKKK